MKGRYMDTFIQIQVKGGGHLSLETMPVISSSTAPKTAHRLISCRQSNHAYKFFGEGYKYGK